MASSAANRSAPAPRNSQARRDAPGGGAGGPGGTTLSRWTGSAFSVVTRGSGGGCPFGGQALRVLKAHRGDLLRDQPKQEDEDADHQQEAGAGRNAVLCRQQ